MKNEPAMFVALMMYLDRAIALLRNTRLSLGDNQIALADRGMARRCPGDNRVT